MGIHLEQVICRVIVDRSIQFEVAVQNCLAVTFERSIECNIAAFGRNENKAGGSVGGEDDTVVTCDGETNFVIALRDRNCGTGVQRTGSALHTNRAVNFNSAGENRLGICRTGEVDFNRAVVFAGGNFEVAIAT